MITIAVRNVNQAFSEVFWQLKTREVYEEPTRNGPALVFADPVTTVYREPKERVLFHQGRDANPIFHLMESIWMLAGRHDVRFLSQFNSRIEQYSDDGITFNAAYGYRWRHYFGDDQLYNVINLLKEDPKTRQAVLLMWSPIDLKLKTRDKACNTQIFFDLRRDQLNMTVTNRSNDIWWGAYGANAVHFSFLQEFVASALQVPVGEYRQFSNNFHLYTELYDARKYVVSPPNDVEYDGYRAGNVTSRPIMENDNWMGFSLDCSSFCRSPFSYNDYQHAFFKHTAWPMAMVSYDRKNNKSDGVKWAEKIESSDWRLATLQWIERREKAKNIAPVT